MSHAQTNTYFDKDRRPIKGTPPQKRTYLFFTRIIDGTPQEDGIDITRIKDVPRALKKRVFADPKIESFFIGTLDRIRSGNKSFGRNLKVVEQGYIGTPSNAYFPNLAHALTGRHIIATRCDRLVFPEIGSGVKLFNRNGRLTLTL